MSNGPDHGGSKRTRPRAAAPSMRRAGELLEVVLARLAGLPPPGREELIQADQRGRWQRGERVFVETYLAHLPGNVPAETLLDLIYAEVLLREELRDRPQLAEYQRRFPQHAEALARQFAVHEALEGDALVSSPVSGAKPSPDLSFPTAAPVIPGYEILGELGRGGLGVVYKARQISLNRLVALKMIRATGGPAHIARFRVEAEASARLQHPNIVQIHEVGESRGRPFLALEFVDGPSLAQELNGAPLPPREAARLIETIARAMHYAHLQGIIHRDLKPANILLAQVQSPKSKVQSQHQDSGLWTLDFGLWTVKVADFGLAKLNDGLPGQTQTGEIVGTPAYMAPEQVQGRAKAVGPWTDVHALGVILYEMLSGHQPFGAATPVDTLVQVAYAEPPLLSQAKVPRDLEVICLKCLQKEPRRRYASAQDLADDLRRFLNGEPVRARPARRMERLWKWARRRRAFASLLALLLVVVLTVVAGIVAVAWESRRLGDAMNRMGRAERDAETERGEIDQVRRTAEDWQRQAEQARTAETELRSQTAAARNQAELARQQAAAARAEARQERYFSQLARAENARQNDDPARAQLLLEECPADLRNWEWRYLKRFCRVRRLTLEQPTERITAAAWHPEGKLLATAGPNGVRLFDSAGKFQDKLDGRGCLAFSPDGHFLATAGKDSVLLWAAQKPGRKPLHVLRGPAGPIAALAFSSDSQRLAAASDRTVRIWNAAAWEQPPTLLAGHAGPINAIAFSPNGKHLASASDDRTVRFWDIAKDRAVSHRQPAKPTALAFFAPGMLAVAGQDGVIRTQEARTGKVQYVLEGHAGAVGSLTAVKGRLASVGEDGLVKVWDTAAGQELLRLPGFGGAAFSPDGGLLLAGELRGGAAVWSAMPPPVATTCEGHTGPVEALAFRPDGKFLVSAGRDKSIRMWDATAGKEKMPILQRRFAVSGVAVSSDDRWLATAGGSDAESELVLRDLAGQKERALTGHKGAVHAVAFRPDGKQFASAGADGTVRLWEPESGRHVRSLSGHTGAVAAVAFRGDSKQLASAGAGGVKIWNLQTGEVERTLELPGDRATAVAFSPDGTRLAAANRAGAIQLWDATGRPLATLAGHPSAVTGLAFSPDGSRLASAGRDGSVRIWETAGGREVLILFGHRGSVSCVAFHPTGACLATGGRDHTVRLWMAAP